MEFLRILLLAICLVSTARGGLFDQNCNSEACETFKELRAKRQNDRSDQFEALEALLGKYEGHAVGRLGFHDLINGLQKRRIKAELAVSVFMMKALNATNRFNCVTEFIPEALEQARNLDKLSTPRGPLHGLPFCVKEDHNIKGMDTTLGYSRNLFKPANSTATLVKILEHLGAIPFCKTNLPQTMMAYSSDNPIYGQTLNPLNPKMSPGGSSSGSGCLVGSGAVHFATGTDAAGSGRIPAHFNGISSIMPTPKRLSIHGIAQAVPNLVGIDTVPALFADKPSTLTTIFKALTENGLQNRFDPMTVPLAWNSNVFANLAPLRFGYVKSIPFFPTLGDTPKVILKTKNQLEELGHTVVPFDLPSGYESMKLFGDILFADGGKYISNMLKDDEVSSAFKTFYYYMKVPEWTRRLVGSINLSERIQLVLRGGLDTESSEGLQMTISAARRIRSDILQQMKEKNVDLLLTPVMPIPATRLEDPPNLFLAVPYVNLWNLVGFPAGVIPRGIETGKEIDRIAVGTSGDIFLHLARTNLRNAVGMPIGVQIVGQPYKEEEILRAMVELEKFTKTSS